MTLTGGAGNDREFKVTPNSTGRVDGVLAHAWDPALPEWILIDNNGSKTYIRDISVIPLNVLPEYEATMGGSATTVNPGDYITPIAAGLADKWATGSSNRKVGRVLNTAAAGEKVKYISIDNEAVA